MLALLIRLIGMTHFMIYDRCHPSKGQRPSQDYHDVQNTQLVGLDTCRNNTEAATGHKIITMSATSN